MIIFIEAQILASDTGKIIIAASAIQLNQLQSHIYLFICFCSMHTRSIKCVNIYPIPMSTP